MKNKNLKEHNKALINLIVVYTILIAAKILECLVKCS